MLNAYDTCAVEPDACWQPPPGLYAVAGAGDDGAGDVILPCPAGSGPNAARDGCVPCAAGFYATLGSGCRPCGGGSYGAAPNATACALCAPGGFSPALSLPAGYGGGAAVVGGCYSDRALAAGACSAQAATACTACPAGTSAPSAGAAGCTPCLAGAYAPAAGTPACLLCAAGTYGVVNQSSLACTQRCDPLQGLYSGAGASACVYCVGGLTNGSACVGCGLGSYEEAVAAAFGGAQARRCVRCPAGTVQLRSRFAVNATACAPCGSPFLYAAADGASCVATSPGYVASADGTGQVACPAGTFATAAAYGGAAAAVGVGGGCAPCAPGTWSDAGAAACQNCTAGSARAAEEQTGCVACGTGLYASAPGQALCAACPAGQEPTPGHLACQACRAGYYAPPGVGVCALCRGGLTTLVAGASACAPCPPWTRLSAPGQCGGCGAGGYMAPSEQDPSVYQCMACPAGKYNALAGAVSPTACGACAPNSYVPWPSGGGATRCAPCLPGAASTDAQTCRACAAGNYSADGLGCPGCPPGNYSTGSGRSACAACAAGSFAGAPGRTACDPCPAGTFGASAGASACARCPLAQFSAAAGATACRARTMACAPGSYVVSRVGQAAQDNGCAVCQGCAPTEFAAIIPAAGAGWTSLRLVDGAAVPPGLCPGNTTDPGYRCLSNDWPPQQYLQYGDGVGAAVGADGMTGFRTLPCTDLTPTPGLPAALVAAYRLMDFVRGPTYECYVACRYGVNPAMVAEYARASPDPTGRENPAGNLFFPSTAKAFLLGGLCLPCSRAACTALPGRYRPVVDATNGCGPPCGITPSECLEATATGGAAGAAAGGAISNDGCVAPCDPPPANAVFVGGAPVGGNASSCPFACVAGYHLSDDGTACEACGACAGLRVPVPSYLCLPYSRTAEVCRPCPSIPGGWPSAWLVATTAAGADGGNTSAAITGGRCAYRCMLGAYYPNADASACLPCDGLNNNGVACPVGTFRDVATCRATGAPPACAPCTTPPDLVSASSGLRVTFQSAGVPADADNCSALCGAGFHTILRGVGSPERGPTSYSYVADAYGAAAPAVWGIACVPCGFADPVPCHGACGRNYYRDPRVPLDTTPGACRRCTTNADCALGQYAPLCLGNGTGDVGCLACPALPPGRVFVPFAATQGGLAAQRGLVRASWVDGFACASACAPDYVLGADGVTCVACADFIAAHGCASAASPILAAGQPRACDFRYAHWNATDGPMWWDAPQNTPAFLRGLRPLPSGAYARAGVCWACPLGLGTGVDDLCELLPGFGLAEQVTVVQVPIPTLGDDLILTLREPRPAVPPSLLLQLPVAAPAGTGARRLLQLPSPPGAAMMGALIPTRVGTYNDGSSAYASGCPDGTSTRAEGSTSVAQCECKPGYFNLSRTARGGCAQCPPDTYRSILMAPDACVPCPPQETTFGHLGQSVCACRAGWMRGGSAAAQSAAGQGNGSAASGASGASGANGCQPCAPGVFCTPCFDSGQTATCPAATRVWTTPCMPGGTSPAGSSSALNCTCSQGRARLLRPGVTPAMLAAPTLAPPSNAGLYCLDVPPHAVYDARTLTLGCPPGWTPVPVPNAPDQLQGCALCGVGRYAAVPLPTRSGTPPVCLPCPLGTYAGGTDALGGCTPCGRNLTTLAVGATSAADCACPPGTRRNAAQQCLGCPLGQYPTPDRLGCLACPPGSTAGIGALNATDCQCNAGSVAAFFGGECVPCAIGTYAARAGMRACTPCGPNRVTAAPGATSASACACAKGFVAVSGVLCRNSSLLLVGV